MKETIGKILAVVFVCIFVSGLVFGQGGNNGDVILRAIQDEMDRALKDLKLKDFDKPYFLQYGVEDEESLSIDSSNGALLRSNRNRIRFLTVQVRVGSYDFDSVGGANPVRITLDEDYNSVRRAVWSITDTAYKRAINQLAARKAQQKGAAATDDDEEKDPGFTKANPTVSIEKKGSLKIDKKKWEAQIRTWSKLFRAYPQLRTSRVNFYVRQKNRYLINTEGTRILSPRLLITLNIYASASTPDNSRLSPSRHIFAKKFDELPSNAEVEKVIKQLAADLTVLRKAPKFTGKYIGPALFTDRAAVQLFHQLLSNNLNSDGLVERLGRKILPSFLSIVDDPTKTEFNGFRLIGDYKIDDEGTPATPLTLVENGVLKTLLTTRDTIKEVPGSNGRARSRGRGFVSGSISNLFVKAKSEKTFAQLKRELIEACRQQGLSYGILFREIDSTFSPSGRDLSEPIKAYKVYVEDGREELIRGATISDLPVRELRHILAAGNDAHPFNILIGRGHNGRGIPVSIVAPSILIEEIYLKKNSSRKEKPLILTNPVAGK